MLPINFLFLLSLPSFLDAEEKVIPRFDENEESVEQLSLLLQEAAAEGATVVRFPRGRWQWHDLTRLGLSPIEESEKKEFVATRKTLQVSIENWISENGIQAVLITIDKESPARIFFLVERLLTGMEIPYGFAGGADLGRNRFLLQETDGRVRIVAPKVRAFPKK